VNQNIEGFASLWGILLGHFNLKVDDINNLIMFEI
jgi:hypothetical protein